MKKTSKNFLACSFLNNIPYTVMQFLQNGGRAKESYKGIGGDSPLRLFNTSDIIINSTKCSKLFMRSTKNKQLKSNNYYKLVALNQRQEQNIPPSAQG